MTNFEKYILPIMPITWAVFGMLVIVSYFVSKFSDLCFDHYLINYTENENRDMIKARFKGELERFFLFKHKKSATCAEQNNISNEPLMDAEIPHDIKLINNLEKYGIKVTDEVEVFNYAKAKNFKVTSDFKSFKVSSSIAQKNEMCSFKAKKFSSLQAFSNSNDSIIDNNNNYQTTKSYKNCINSNYSTLKSFNKITGKLRGLSNEIIIDNEIRSNNSYDNIIDELMMNNKNSTIKKSMETSFKNTTSQTDINNKMGATYFKGITYSDKNTVGGKNEKNSQLIKNKRKNHSLKNLLLKDKYVQQKQEKNENSLLLHLWSNHTYYEKFIQRHEENKRKMGLLKVVVYKSSSALNSVESYI